MSYANFKPTIWSKAIQTALHERTILADYCNKEFEGDAKLGGKVKIIGAVAPTIFDYTPGTDMQAPETQDGTETLLEITQAKAFNVEVDDVDAAQMNGIKVLPILCSEAGKKLAAARDRYVASLVTTLDGYADISSQAIGTTKKALDVLDEAILTLRERNVEPTDEARIELPWWMYLLVKKELVEAKTSNDNLISRGVIGWYDGFGVVASNCLHTDGADTCAMVRTKKAIALADSVQETEAYRPERRFSDAIKGLSVYGAKIVRPEEIVVIKAHKG